MLFSHRVSSASIINVCRVVLNPWVSGIPHQSSGWHVLAFELVFALAFDLVLGVVLSEAKDPSTAQIYAVAPEAFSAGAVALRCFLGLVTKKQWPRVFAEPVAHRPFRYFLFAEAVSLTQSNLIGGGMMPFSWP